jgi:PHD/YefM family antitoxin component YafN of YafNO toxin-antitoxin module
MKKMPCVNVINFEQIENVVKTIAVSNSPVCIKLKNEKLVMTTEKEYNNLEKQIEEYQNFFFENYIKNNKELRQKLKKAQTADESEFISLGDKTLGEFLDEL